MKPNPLLGLKSLGQSIWLDYIQRELLVSGELLRLIQDDGVAGVTSNPAIFEKAIAHNPDYDEAIALLRQQGASPLQAYESLTVEDIRHAADLLLPFHEQSRGLDGYVSLEVSPTLARDSKATVEEAQRLWQRVARPNLMIKVPSTLEGLAAIRTLISRGINVNATLLFSVERYTALAQAYLTGLEERQATGLPLDRVASVASFFLSRIDSLVDPRLDALNTPEAASLRGQAATASARLAYQEFKSLMASDRWQRLARAGAMPQRLLWASTSAKDPAYDDLKYVTPLIGPDTVNTLPPDTLAAFRDHGKPEIHLEEDLDRARALPEALAGLGIHLDAVAQQLEEEGVRKFADPYDKLLATLASRLTPAP